MQDSGRLAPFWVFYWSNGYFYKFHNIVLNMKNMKRVVQLYVHFKVASTLRGATSVDFFFQKCKEAFVSYNEESDDELKFY